MRELYILIIVSLMESSDGQYPECVSCADGSIPLSSLSYNTVRSNVFSGRQPSNEGCTNGAIVNGQVTINCGQGTTLIDCDRGLNTNPDYSDLSNTFAWNRTTSVAGQVPIVFRFYQQINISRISLFFWNSQSNSIIIPNVMMYWSNDDSITPSNEISTTSNSPNRNGDRRGRLNIDVNDNGLQFQYLRIVMSFYDDSEWMFLSEVSFCSNTAPYNITDPSTDNDVQIVSPTATMASVTCSLNVTIPFTTTVMWIHNNSIPIDEVTTTGDTTTLQIGDLQPSDVGVYQCVFNDSIGSGWILRRNIKLIVADPRITYPLDDFHVYLVTFTPLTNSIQLMCSLNVPIPSSVTVIWSYNTISLVRSPNEVTTTGGTTTLVLRELQPSDAGLYQCTFIGLNLRRAIQLEYRNITIVSAAATTITTTSIGITSYPITSISINTVIIDSIPSSTTAVAAIVTTTSLNLSTPSTSQSADSSSSSVGVIVAIVVLVVVVFIIITVVVVGIIVVWKRKKSQQHAKPTEGVYYSTIDETTLQRPPPSKPEAVYSEVNDKQDNKEPQYMDVTGGVHSTKQADKIIMQDNPAYSVHQTKDDPATDYSIPNDQQVIMQDNPAYSVANM